jgi:hypothetical protein
MYENNQYFLQHPGWTLGSLTVLNNNGIDTSLVSLLDDALYA